MGIWTEFAKSGQPNCEEISEVEWQPIVLSAGDPFKCLNIADDVKIVDLPEHERMQLWDGLYAKDQLI